MLNNNKKSLHPTRNRDADSFILNIQNLFYKQLFFYTKLTLKTMTIKLRVKNLIKE